MAHMVEPVRNEVINHQAKSHLIIKSLRMCISNWYLILLDLQFVWGIYIL